MFNLPVYQALYQVTSEGVLLILFQYACETDTISPFPYFTMQLSSFVASYMPVSDLPCQVSSRKASIQH